MIFYTINENNIQSSKIESAGIPIEWMSTAMTKMSKDYPTLNDISEVILVFVKEPIQINTPKDIAKQYKITKGLQLVALPINTQLSVTLNDKDYHFQGDKISLKSLESMKKREVGLPQSMTAQEMLALNWLKEGKIGTSSKTMCFEIFPQLKEYYDANKSNNNFGPDTPHDNSDFIRCMNFVNQVNIFPDQLEKVAKINEKWAKLVDKWELIERLVLNSDVESQKLARTIIKECINEPDHNRKPKF